MLYVYGTVCNEFNVGQKRPPTSFWTMKLLKEREHEEINARGIGKGELQGPFVEEDGPMPEDEDGFLWKLNTYVDNIRKERDGFERTFVAASNVLRVNTLPKVVYNNSKDYNSLAFALGPATQKDVFTRVNKVVEEFESSKKGNDFEAPSFSFRVTQDFDMVLSLETPVTDTNTHVLGSSKQLEPINTVPMSMCKTVLKDEDVVHGRDNAVVDTWSGYLIFLESLRVSYLKKIECPRDKKMFGNESKANTSITNYLMDVETVNERVERKNMINLVDLNTMLARLRKRYAATLLLSKCNMHSDSVCAQLDGIQVAEVPVKRMKLPTRGK
nr:C2 calcium-dependent membrane targeting [Tanacetum cinerariifolium]